MLIDLSNFSKKLILVKKEKCLYIELVKIILSFKMILEFQEMLDLSK